MLLILGHSNKEGLLGLIVPLVGHLHFLNRQGFRQDSAFDEVDGSGDQLQVVPNSKHF